MRILVTCFEPFGGQMENSSRRAAMALPGRIGFAEIYKAILPVSWSRVGLELGSAVEREVPDMLLMTGQAAGSDRINIERLGINLSNGVDGDGESRADLPVIHGAPDAHFSTFDFCAVRAALEAEEIKSAYSFSAGTYLCNFALYYALDKYPSLPAGFLHLPLVTGQADDRPTVGADTLTRALEVSIRAMIDG